MSKSSRGHPAIPATTARKPVEGRWGGGYLADARGRSKALVAITMLVLAGSAQADEPPVPLLAHTATYELRLESRSTSAMVTSIHGVLAITLEDTCDAWRVRQGLVLTMARDDEQIVTASEFDSLEAKDGSKYSFDDQTSTVPGSKERSSGQAGGGVVHLERPKIESLELPPDVIFPMAHLIDILRRAEAGERFLSHILYDGTDGATIYDVTTVIGRAGRSPDDGQVVWPMRLAFFIHGSEVETPDLEIDVSLRRDGVIEAIVYDYGTFRIGAELTAVDELPPPDC